MAHPGADDRSIPRGRDMHCPGGRQPEPDDAVTGMSMGILPKQLEGADYVSDADMRSAHSRSQSSEFFR